MNATATDKSTAELKEVAPTLSEARSTAQPGELVYQVEALAGARIAVSEWVSEQFILPVKTTTEKPTFTMKINPNYLMIIMMLALILFFAPGCEQQLTLKAPTAPGKVQAGDPVTVDNQPAGYCKSVNPGGEAVMVITNKVLAETLRRGTVHIPERGKVALDTSGADPASPRLRNGETVMARSKVAQFARQWSKGAVLLVGLAAVVLGISIAKLLLFKMAGPWIPLILAAALSAGTAWMLNGFVSPVITDLYMAGLTDAGRQGGEVATNASGRWQARMVDMLGTQPDGRLIAFCLVAIITLPVWLWFVCRLRRASRAACSLLIPSMLFLSAAAVSAEPTGTSFTRDFLVEEQAKANRLIADSEQACAQANRLVEAGLAREAASDLVQINFNMDRAEVALRGHLDRVKNLKPSALRYIASEEKRRLGESFNLANVRLIACQSHASTLHQRLIKVNEKEALPLQLYLAQRTRYAQRIQYEGLVDARNVLAEVNQLVRFGLPVVRAGLVTSENIGACRLNDNGNITLPNGLVVSPDGKAVSVTAVVTNTVTNVLRIATPAPPPVTNKVVEKVVQYVTNTQQVAVHRTNVVRIATPAPSLITNIVERFITNTVQVVVTNTPAPVTVASAPPPSTNLAMPVSARTGTPTNAASTSASEPETAHLLPTAPVRAPSPSPSNAVVKVLIVVAVAALLVGLLILGVASNGRKHPARIELAEAGTDVRIEFTLVAPDDAVVLDDDPHVAPITMRGSSPAIGRDWRGQAILIANDNATSNGDPVSGRVRLNPGDTISIGEADGSMSWKFRCLGAVESPALDPSMELTN